MTTLACSLDLNIEIKPSRHLKTAADRFLRQLADSVSAQYGVTTAQLCGEFTANWISVPRQAFMCAAYDTGRYSYPTIGGFLGGRDHTTIIAGVRCHRQRLAELSTPNLKPVDAVQFAGGPLDVKPA
jgi:chromosomal replication initiation ATPase DnaA